MAVIGCLAAAVTAAPAVANTKPNADYQFEGNLKSAVAGVPNLKALGTGGAFKRPRIMGTRDGVWTWPAGDGLRLDKASKAVGAAGHYTIAMLVNLDSVDGYRKLVDFENLTADTGWYVYYESLYPYDLTDFDYTHQVIQAGTWRQIVLTRGKGGVVRGYVDGKKLGEAVDSAGDESLGADKVLNFLIDDQSGTEFSGGKIARLRLWDAALSGKQIKHLGH
jgi:Concanavalin A-like lectin/glucanases superfamily